MISSFKHCSKCKAEFECKADSTGCWCEAYTISPTSLKELKDGFADCLCPACLAQYSEQEKQPPAPANDGHHNLLS